MTEGGIMGIQIVFGLLMFNAIFHDITWAAPTTFIKEKQEDEKQNETTVFEYDLQVKLENDQILQEKFRINTKMKTEYISVPKHNDMEEIEVIQDFLKNLTAIHVKSKHVCFISKLVSGSFPKQLKTAVENKSISEDNNLVLNKTTTWKIDKVFTQRSLLSEEMAIMCARSSIYWLQKVEENGSRQSRDIGHSRVRRSSCGTTRLCWIELEIRIIFTANGKPVSRPFMVKRCNSVVVSC